MLWRSILAIVLFAHPWALAAQDRAAETSPAVSADETESETQSDTVRYLIDTGPLRIRDQFQFGMGFLAFDPVSAVVLQKGEWQVDVISTLTNAWAQSDHDVLTCARVDKPTAH